jgi:hypothetical protein
MNMMRVLLDYARRNGSYVTTDVQPRWYLEHQLINRFYLKVANNQGGAKAAAVASGVFALEKVADAKRLQVGDYIALMFATVPLDRGANSSALNYYWNGASYKTTYEVAANTVLPEVCRIVGVDYDNGLISVARNQAGDDRTTDYKGIGVEVIANTATPDLTNEIMARDAFFIPMGNSLTEGRNDQLIWSTSNTWDWNNCQFVGRKWGATDIQQNVYRRGETEPNIFVKNRRLALEALFDQLEYQAILGFRKTETTPEGKWKGWFGGMLEYIPTGHLETFQRPDYSSFSSKPGDFSIPNFNKKLDNKFYYGSQEKVLLCGVDFHTAFSTMINYMTQSIPTIVDGWSVKGSYFEASNAGRLFVVPSDKLSLNGLSHVGILFDPASFQYGHLQNMDMTIIDDLGGDNPHEKAGEVYGVLTMKRTNPDANWLFTLDQNTQ